ncbi:phenylalanine--tRNA ligase subunit beta [Cyanobium sp. Morenito 9A2]|uniref:phenylalanine--tRNA ligase subunit beta n=1 Tax=Cyanobium sp. Morenito 9A2 TaxID=2823718 RepID=UPI0020CC2930|nr:phenylalanine--tRNA ligase subunit beta [Cyanobium sp. Morenito 9A2]MCP9850577.1 phenylalanine--tRNA ligase subunit beta [Cyanobium sp. Morenito 9A2]
MRVSLQWLKELVACDTPAAELAERLSMAGFEVESIEDLAAQAAGVVVGYVSRREPHPNADKLSVCSVDVGAEQPLQIVCGATNVRAGLHVPVALVGAHLPAVTLTIKPAELRGVASSGMICSLKELGLADGSAGIAVLDELLESVPPVGTAVGPSLGLDDQVLELAITANRPDGLSMQGIAREVAALTHASLTLAPAAPVQAAEPLGVSPDHQAAIERGGLFSVTALRGVRVEPSPRWLQQRLERAGLRAVNNVVDITNLVMLETGQPLHAFDSDRLAALGGGSLAAEALGLRQGREGEIFEALDGSTLELDDEALVVTYADQPIALAGVIGGASSAVHGGTTNLWLEAAVFAPQQVRRSARSAGLRTEASARFEKGLPREVTLSAADRAVQWLVELTGAEPTGRYLHQKPQQPAEPLTLRRDALHQLLGPVVDDGEAGDLPDDAIEQTLGALGCVLKPTELGWQVAIPASRALDLLREVDLIEEVARLVGYDRFATHLPDPLGPGGLSPAQEVERRLRRALCQAGLQETCALSLVVAGPGRLPLANPLLSDYGHLRDNLIDELLEAARRNLQAGSPGFWAFELGHVFSPQAKGEPQLLQLAGVISGSRSSELWSSGGKPISPSYYEARGLLERALGSLGLDSEDRPLRQQPQLHPGRAAELVVEGRGVGWFGQLHPERAEALDLPEATHLFQLEVPPLLTAATRRNRWQASFSPFPTVPAAERDLALVVPRTLLASQLLHAIRKAGKPLLEHVELVDRYEGEQLGADRCSQAFRLRYREASRTLTDGEVEEAHSRIRQALEKQFDAQLR